MKQQFLIVIFVANFNEILQFVSSKISLRALNTILKHKINGNYSFWIFSIQNSVGCTAFVVKIENIPVKAESVSFRRFSSVFFDSLEDSVKQNGVYVLYYTTHSIRSISHSIQQAFTDISILEEGKNLREKSAENNFRFVGSI